MSQSYDFDVFIVQGNKDYTVQARAVRVGELPAQPLTLPFNLAGLPERRRDVAEWIRYARESRLRGPEELREARTFGKGLFDSLFTNEMLAAFRSSRSNLVPGEHLRLRLRLPSTLAVLPWELLYDQYTDQFLALAPDLTLVRYPEMPAASHQIVGPLQVHGPLQVVTVLASPQSDDYPALRIDRELGRLELALKQLLDRGQVQLDVIRGPGTLDQLRERLRHPVHILHILSHGDLNRETGEGELLFEDTDGAAEPINAELLRMELEQQFGQVQLITLNACLGALPVGDDPFSSVGMALIRSGVPAVVAMQFEIAEDVAAELTRVLYAELASGVPVDQAIGEARRRIYGRHRTRLDWAIPVLFSRTETGLLFEFATLPGPSEQVKQQARPNPPEQTLKLSDLDQLWHKAQAAYLSQDWGQANALFSRVAEIDATYADVQAKLREVRLHESNVGKSRDTITSTSPKETLPKKKGNDFHLIIGHIFKPLTARLTSFPTPNPASLIIKRIAKPFIARSLNWHQWLPITVGVLALVTVGVVIALNNLKPVSRSDITPTSAEMSNPGVLPPLPVNQTDKIVLMADPDNKGTFEIYTVIIDGSELKALTDNQTNEIDPTWSPDGTQIAYASDSEGNYEIFVMRADGTEVRRLTHEGATDFAPTWSPDSTQIAFTSNRDGDFEIYTMNAIDGGNITKLTNNGSNDLNPDWSPDGKWISFATNRSGSDFEVYKLDVQTKEEHRLTDDGSDDMSPSWSPDSKLLAFSSNRFDKNFEICVMRAEGNPFPARITQNGANDIAPAWSIDGKTLAFVSDRSVTGQAGIYLISQEGEGTEKNSLIDTHIPLSTTSWSQRQTEYPYRILDIARR